MTTTTRSSDKGYTIAEAADSLRLPKKTLRHVLGRPDRKARLLREYRNTKKGLITVEIVPDDLYEELAASTANIAVPLEGAAQGDRGIAAPIEDVPALINSVTSETPDSEAAADEKLESAGTSEPTQQNAGTVVYAEFSWIIRRTPG